MGGRVQQYSLMLAARLATSCEGDVKPLTFTGDIKWTEQKKLLYLLQCLGYRLSSESLPILWSESRILPFVPLVAQTGCSLKNKLDSLARLGNLASRSRCTFLLARFPNLAKIPN